MNDIDNSIGDLLIYAKRAREKQLLFSGLLAGATCTDNWFLFSLISIPHTNGRS